MKGQLVSKDGKSKATPATAPSRVRTVARGSSPVARPARGVDKEARRAMVAQAAYFRAEKRGFAAGNELNDWVEAEREIAHMLDG